MNMKNKFFVLPVFFTFTFIFSFPAAFAAHWSYDGLSGPDYWSTLNPDYEAAMGSTQSPIDIETSSAVGHHGKKLSIRYRDGAFSILNNGHTIQLAPAKEGENYITLDGERYDLLQFHFHVPSEHKINGKTLEMELHFVNRSASGRLAVIGVLFQGGDANNVVVSICDAIPTSHEEGTQPKLLKDMLPITSLLPKELENIQYNGSLTTPPTLEGVLWIVLKEHLDAGAEQIKAFRSVIGGNARPVQPLNGRLMYAGEAETE